MKNLQPSENPSRKRFEPPKNVWAEFLRNVYQAKLKLMCNNGGSEEAGLQMPPCILRGATFSVKKLRRPFLSFNMQCSAISCPVKVQFQLENMPRTGEKVLFIIRWSSVACNHPREIPRRAQIRGYRRLAYGKQIKEIGTDNFYRKRMGNLNRRLGAEGNFFDSVTLNSLNNISSELNGLKACGKNVYEELLNLMNIEPYTSFIRMVGKTPQKCFALFYDDHTMKTLAEAFKGKKTIPK